MTLGSKAEGWTRARAELADTLALVRKGLWPPPAAAPAVEQAREGPTLHEFASEWFQRNRPGVGERTAECRRWPLSHVLEELAPPPVSRLTVERVDAYRARKVRERERLAAELAAWLAVEPGRRGPRPARPLSNGSINRTPPRRIGR